MGQKRTDDELVAIGRRLKQARIALGLIQKEISQSLGVKYATWNHWETGKRIPDPLAMKDFYLKYGITMEWVYAGDPKGLPYKLD